MAEPLARRAANIAGAIKTRKLPVIFAFPSRLPASSDRGEIFRKARSGQRHDLLARNAALRGDLALEGETRLNPGAIGSNVDQLPVANLAQARILGHQHVLVLLESAFDLFEQLLGRRRLVLPIRVGGRPDEPTGML